ncbi:MAG: acyl-ACP--UDP-N-acetylglucosamine O-acyltransferase [Desulfobacterales bacterium]
MIHPTAIVDANASLATDVEVGPYAVIKEDVSIGSGTVVGPHVVIEPFVEIQSDCHIFQGAALGGIPQSTEFKGERTHLRIGKGTIIREFATLHRGTGFGGGVTEIGDRCYLMTYAHVGHDCTIGNDAMLVNNATLAGHVTIGNHANVGAFTPVHQFVRVGDHAFIAGGSIVIRDIPPYVLAVGNRAKLSGLNTVGLKRQGFSSEALSQLKKAYRIVFRKGLKVDEAIETVNAEVESIPEVVTFIDFIRSSQSSQRGLTR